MPRTAFIVYYDHDDPAEQPFIGDVLWELKKAEERWGYGDRRNLHVTDLTQKMLDHHHLP